MREDYKSAVAGAILLTTAVGLFLGTLVLCFWAYWTTGQEILLGFVFPLGMGGGLLLAEVLDK